MAKQQQRRRDVRRRTDNVRPFGKGVKTLLRRHAEAGDKLAAAALADAERNDNTIVNAVAALIGR